MSIKDFNMHKFITLLFLLIVCSFDQPKKLSVPSFSGGDKALYDFINYRYSHTEDFVNNNFTSRSIVTIKIDPKGTATVVRFIKSSGKDNQREITSIIKSMPKWRPAYKNHKAIESTRVLNFPSGNITQEYLDGLYRRGKPMRLPDKMPQPRINIDSYISKHLSLKNNQGAVLLKFIVNKDGSLTEFTVLRHSQKPEMDKQVVKILSNMPHWQPAKYQGQAVRCIYYIRYNY